MPDVQETLHAALDRFIDDAVGIRKELRSARSNEGSLPGVEEFAEKLAGLPSAEAVDAAAVEAAVEHAYILRPPREGVEIRPAGRPLTKEALIETGVAPLLLTGESVDSRVLVAEMAGYLAGPTVPLWDYAIIDARMKLNRPVPVVDGWELLTPSAHELAQLVAVPSAAKHARRRSFDLDLYGGLAMLRRVDPEGEPHSGLVLRWPSLWPAHALWKPLLVISLYDNAVVHLWAQYDVEPARRVDVLFDRVYTEPWTPDGLTEVEVVRYGEYVIDMADEPRFRRFCGMVAPLLDRALAQPTPSTKAARERAARLRRISEHLLTAGEEAHGQGEVLSEFNAEAVLHYVIALEAVLAGDESDKTELTRKVVQRAAVLAGTSDEDRLAVANTVRTAYAARSTYAHGGEPEDIDLPALRSVVRDSVLARLVLGDPPIRKDPLAKLVDRALLDYSCLESEVREPVSAFWNAVDGS